jgi:hypothetical protein
MIYVKPAQTDALTEDEQNEIFAAHDSFQAPDR